MLNSKYDVTIIGSGFFGTTIANLISTKLNKSVLILEKRDHPGGNSWSKIDTLTQIEYHPYGSHIFHTSNDQIWNYVNQFGKFTNYQHRVYSVLKNRLIPIPVNLQTINMIYDSIFTPSQARELIDKEIEKEKNRVNPLSLEGKAILTFGRKIYENLIKDYTQKQWQTDPNILPSATISRIPLRFDLNSNYFEDQYQGLPLSGYNNLIGNMLAQDKITLLLDTDFFEMRKHINSPIVIYTGPIDKYFDYNYQPLSWRTLDFEYTTLETSDFQGCAVINDPTAHNRYTRTHEFKHLHPERVYESKSTLIAKEYSRFAGVNDEPYYPVNSLIDKEKLNKYKLLVKKEEKNGVFFGGRLATYKYLDMHMAIGSAHTLFNKVKDYL